jgi:hypothetical protein
VSYDNCCQKWVFVSVEVLHHTWRYYRQKQWMDKFDWTMTYRSDSEGYGPYGKIILAKIIKNEISQFVYSQFLIVYAFLFTKSGGAYHNIVKL